MTLHIHRRLIRWGNGYGIRLTAKEVERLGIQAGQTVEADIHAPPSAAPDAPVWHLGGGDVERTLDEGFGDDD